MSTYPSMQIEKHFTYRGAQETFVNRYHFHGGTPADIDAWTTLVHAVADAEKLIFSQHVTYSRAVCYANDEDPSLHAITLTQVGDFTPGTIVFAPGDSAFRIRWWTPKRDSKAHPVYKQSYYHDVALSAATGGDAIWGGQITRAQTFGAAWVTGFTDGGSNTYTLCLPDGTLCSEPFVYGNAGRRKLKRRG